MRCIGLFGYPWRLGSAASFVRADTVTRRPEQRARRRLRLSKAQADTADFQARLTLLGEPRTLNQALQLRTSKRLLQIVGQRQAHAKGQAI
jgi:hypothetical protein